jgi:predicted PurR-regulated permease PerM
MYESDATNEKKSIDLAIKLTLIALIAVWCAMIILPFVVPVLWGIILAITLFPLYRRLLTLFRGKKGLSSLVITLILLALIITPSVFLISSIVENAKELVASIREHSLVIPPPEQKVAEWPLIGKPIHAAWLALSTNFEAAVQTYREQILSFGEKFLTTIKSVLSSILMLVLSVIISGIFLVGAENSEKSALKFTHRIFGKTGDEMLDMVIVTIRNVAKGILGVAFIQFVLVGAVLILAKVPFAGLWALAALLFAIVQIPVGIVAIPVVIYLYSAREPLPATVWSIIIILVSMSDNVLKPWLMGKGAPVPMLVIFLGAVGGMIMSGFIGLFTGAIVLSLGYKLATIWIGGGLQDRQTESTEKSS